ncbi:contact-dependent growth inhibition system immunity protein [Teredinibacter franksiae]|uniref:contact-dependent growth inhibition system immunity protein n=1 Tax=Teredinibacter franksiae TaxID=2761453 RepID=UPI001623E4B1|nr:contact-dependent growth inhibition system immunity protein [Teredinibacter franksiae]
MSNQENLEQFFGCYFHQDFRDDYRTPVGALEAFIEEQPEGINDILVALNELLDMNLGEETMREKLISYDSNYGPWIVNEHTAIEWIFIIHGKLSAANHS